MRVYLVMGTTGEYSDRSEWPVAAYFAEADAQRHVVAAEARADEIFAERESRYDTGDRTSDYDPNISMDYTGTSYYIESASTEGAHVTAAQRFTDET